MKASTRVFILKRDDYICVYCGADATHVDHVMPKSKGGPDNPNNLVAACERCNLRKSADVTEEWLQRGFVQILSQGGNLDWLDYFEPTESIGRRDENREWSRSVRCDCPGEGCHRAG